MRHLRRFVAALAVSAVFAQAVSAQDRDTIWEPGELSEVIPALVAEAAPNAPMSGVREASADSRG